MYHKTKLEIIRTVACVVIGICCIFSAGLLCEYVYRPIPEADVIILLPNQGQLQQILNAIDPNKPLKVDYEIGRLSRNKWDGIIYDAYASPYFSQSGVPKNK